MALSPLVRQVLSLLQGWLRYARRRYVALAGLLFLSIMFASLLSRDSADATIHRILNHGQSKVKPGFFRVLATASTPDVNLCKMVISAIMAGYPTPTLVNWAREIKEKDGKKENLHIARISGVHEYLQNLNSFNDDDLVLVVDGYDIWFQLGPQVLIDRYNEICRQANHRIEARLGSQAVKDLHLHQSIVFSAQKQCWPGGDEDLNCYAVPNSTLPEDIYGPWTDATVDDPKNPSVNYRPRYLSSGLAMGPVGEMRRFYARAMAMYNENPKLASDQSMFARIHGEQEYQREVIRFRYTSWAARFHAWFQEMLGNPSEPSILEPHPTRRKMEPADGAKFDYGLGLDYVSTLGHATVFSEFESDWIIFNNTKTIDEAVLRNNVTKRGINKLNRDVSFSIPPFWTNSRLSVALPDDQSWATVQLYTNLYTGVTPAIIHHNAYRDDMKSLREQVWDKMWFHPYIRDMLRARLHEPYLPVAVTGKQGYEKTWWGPTEKRALGLGAQPANKPKEWLAWKDLMNVNWAEEVFRDKKGVWTEAP